MGFPVAEQFVDELHRRWMARRRPAEVIAIGASPARVLPPEREMPEELRAFVSAA